MLHPATNLADHHRNGPAVHQRAEGVYLWDNKGKQYIEGMAGLWCTALGYGEEELVRAAEQQLRKLSYSQLFAGKTHEPGVLLAEKLKGMMPFDAGRVFFGLSGSDANDTQMKLMWYYHNVIGKPERKKIISRRSGYHGVTVASGSLTGLAPFHAHFDLPIPGVLHTGAPYYYREAHEGETEGRLHHASRQRTRRPDSCRRSGDHRRLHRRAGDGRRWRGRPARRLLREDPGGVASAPGVLHRRRSDLRLRPHRAAVRCPSVGHRADHHDRRQGVVVGLPTDQRRGDSGVHVRAVRRGQRRGRRIRSRVHVLGAPGLRRGGVALPRTHGRTRESSTMRLPSQTLSKRVCMPSPSTPLWETCAASA